jgi:putative membrane protein
MQLIVNLLRGVAIGLANIIPGVSGGTMALILGIYQRLIDAIGNLGPATLTSVFKGRAAFVEEMKRVDAVFLGSLALGAVGVIVAVARLMTYLLQEQHDPTYGFFFGLVLASVLVPYRMIKRKNAWAVISCLLAIAAVVGLTMAMSGEQALESARRKAGLEAAKVEAQAAASDSGAAETAARARAPRVPRDGKTMLLFFVAGVVAISAMILPGISGSFMLLLMGVYFDVLACINNRQLVLLGILALGCLVGLVAFTRLLKYLLANFHDVTMAFLLGLVIGSLYAIWPFKRFEMVGDKRVDLDHILPASLGSNELLTLGGALFGMAIVAAFIWIEIRQQRAAAG